MPQVTLDSRPPVSRVNLEDKSLFLSQLCRLLFVIFIFIFIYFYFILGFQSGAVLCPAAFQHYDGVVGSSSFRGGLSLPSASERGGLRFGVLTLEGVLGVVGISSKQPEHSLHV